MKKFPSRLALGVRTHAAALLLLAPLAAGILATPAAAQQRAEVAVAPAPGIERFVLRTHGRIEPGRELRFRLVGRPGGEAWVRVPGLQRRIELKEERPGVYEGFYTVRRRDNAQSFARAMGNLQHGAQRVVARVQVRGDDVDQPQARDERGPVIADLSPAPDQRVGGRNRMRITARVTDEGSGVDPASVRLVLNGRDVTPELRMEGDEVQFRGFLARGHHTAELEVRDRAGNTTRRAWSFDVRGRG
jgi:hypothetical protein